MQPEKNYITDVEVTVRAVANRPERAFSIAEEEAERLLRCPGERVEIVSAKLEQFGTKQDFYVSVTARKK